jgi:hypothetical protein
VLLLIPLSRLTVSLLVRKHPASRISKSVCHGSELFQFRTDLKKNHSVIYSTGLPTTVDRGIGEVPDPTKQQNTEITGHRLNSDKDSVHYPSS